MAHVDEYGRPFQADQPYLAGSWGYVGGRVGRSSVAVYGTLDQVLYQAARGERSFGYLVDGLAPGLYELKLYFNEAWAPRTGFRRFDVSVEATTLLSAYDPFLYCGSPGSGAVPGAGNHRACAQTFDVTITDGQLNLDFRSLSEAVAFVSAFSLRSLGALPLAAYEEVAQDVGILDNNVIDPQECFHSVATGSAWADFDGDDDLDLYATNHGGPNRLYRNDGDLTGDGLPDFVDVASAVGADDPTGFGQGAVFIDYDNDGDQDLHLQNWDRNILLQNQLVETGSATFLDMTDESGLGNRGRSITAAWGDFDVDGHLDVYVTNHYKCMEPSPNPLQESEDALYRSNGDGTFTDVTGSLCPGGIAPCAQTSGLGFAVGWIDYDDDGDIDLYLVNDMVAGSFYPNVLWRNDGPEGEGGWRFTDVSTASGAASLVNGMGLGIGDFDNDRDFDLAFSNIGPNNLLRNNGNGTFRETSAGAGVQRGFLPSLGLAGQSDQWSWGSVFFDHDNDGWLDLLFGAGFLNDDRPLQPSAFFWNRRDGTFRDISAASGLALPGRVRNISVADFDDDGFVDLFMNNFPDRGLGPFGSGGAYWLFHNEARELGNASHWLKVTVEGTRSNRDGIGSRLWVRNVSNHTEIQVREITSGATHGGGDEKAAYFGLGNADRVDLRVRWPDGALQTFESVAADQHVHLVEPE